MPEQDEVFERANAEANEVFQKLQAVVEDRVQSGDTSINVVEALRSAGLEADDGVLKDLELPGRVPVHAFLPWHIWFPWRPIWCWWWRFHYPWYRCCPYWWHSCHPCR